MKVAILGAGALGGLIGAKLAQTQAQISLIARGPHLEAMQDNGLTLLDPHGYVNLDPIASHTTAFMGPQDYVFVTLRAHQTAGLLPEVLPLIGPRTTIVWVTAGIPFWHDDARAPQQQGAALRDAIPQGQILGCVSQIEADILQPGVIRHLAGDTLLLGEPSGETTLRATRLAKLLGEAGLAAPVVPDIRTHIWGQVLGLCARAPEGLDELSPTALLAQGRSVAEALGFKAAPAELGISDAMWLDLAEGERAEFEAVLGGLTALSMR